MRRSIPVLIVLLALQLGLTAVLAVRENPLAAVTPDTPLIGASLDSVDHIVIESRPAAGATGAARIELVKRDGRWILPGYFDAPADKYHPTALLDELAALKRGLPIGTSSAALRRFQLVDDDFERRVQLGAGGKVVTTLYLGSSGGVRKTDARTAADHAVYSVDLATYDLPTDTGYWLDADLLKRDPQALTELDITRPPAAPMKLLRSAPAAAAASAQAQAASTWSAATPTPGHPLDPDQADMLAQTVAALHVDGILGLSAAPDWQQSHPLLLLGLRDRAHPDQQILWTLSRPLSAQAAQAATKPASSAPDYYVLKSSAQPWYFRISAASAKQLLDDSSPQSLLTGLNATNTGAAAGKDKPPARAERARKTHGNAGA